MVNFGNLSLEKLVVLQDSFFVNCYVIWDTVSKEAFIIDPSVSSPKEQSELEYIISNNGLSVKAVVNTHGHLDHILGNSWAVDKWRTSIFIGKKDERMLSDPALNGSAHFGLSIYSPKASKLLSDNEEIILGEERLKIMHTPGHTEGGISLYYKELFVITGDTLFKEGIGRTDLPGGSAFLIKESIKNSLLTLADSVQVFPGHGPDSTIGHEKKFNTFLL